MFMMMPISIQIKSKESKEKLKLWYSLHIDHLYPTEDEKKVLATEAGMMVGQVHSPNP
jgi:hypothetical protein